MTKTIQSISVASLHRPEKDIDLLKLTENKKNKLRNTALIIKGSAITIVCVLLAIIVFSIFSIHSMHTTGLKPAINIGINKLENDMAFFENRLSTEYGQLKLIGGNLIGQEGISLKNNYKLVDEISSDYDIAATVFARNGNDYRRISTSIADNAGKRAVGTFLETDNAAYPYIQSGSSYTGKDAILGKNYLTEYRPIFAENGKEVIGILFIGKDMTTIEKAVNANIVKYIKRMAVFTLAVLLAYITVSLIVRNIIRRESINEHNSK
jgi:methyl-accepting chemotaxis protein